MNRSSHHLTPRHSTTIPDRKRKAHRVDTNPSDRDGYTSDSSTTALLGNGKKSGNPKEREYAIRSGNRKQDTGTSTKKEKNPPASNHPYSQIITTEQQAHEEKPQSSKHTRHSRNIIT
ncbi:hypothetical protein EAE96_006277 [Botrytis aclada]|nr:hypothetical protein EAE96_006277 [Botrytis aclada]